MLSGHFSLLSRSLFSALGELFSSFFEQDGGSVGYFLGCAEWAYFDSEGGGRLAAALRVRCCRLGRHLFVTLSGLLWRAYTSCERFHLRIGQSAKVFWPILTKAGGRKFLNLHWRMRVQMMMCYLRSVLSDLAKNIYYWLNTFLLRSFLLIRISPVLTSCRLATLMHLVSYAYLFF